MLGVSAYAASERLADFDGQAILASLSNLSPAQVVGAILAVAVAFLAVAGQERAVVQHLGFGISIHAGGRAAIAAAAVSQTAGFGPIVGAIIRRKLLPDLGLGQSFAISVGMALGFFAGLGVLTLACFAFVPDMPHQAVSRLALLGLMLLLGAGALSPGHRIFGRRKPNLIVMGRFLFWLGLDVSALCGALWILLPSDSSYAFLDLLPVFFVALGVGLATGSPGGAGPFEATLLTQSPEIEGSGLLAGIIAFRALAYALPAICGVLWAFAAPRVPARRRPAPAVVHQLSDLGLRALPMAEAQLVRQGELHLLTPQGGQGPWLCGGLAHVRVAIGAPLAAPPRSGHYPADLAGLTRLAHDEARVPCLYKAPPRLAAAARAGGWAVLPLAYEAVLNPMTFTLAGSDRARLRRKLSHMRKAGVTVQRAQTLPLFSMERVARSWAAANHRERGFSMGRWDRAYVAAQQVFTAHTAKGDLCAFVTFHAAQGEWTLDLVRVADHCPDGTIYGLICHALDQARAEGIPRLSLAAVPVPALGLRGVAGRVARWATGRTGGLAQFKSAFAPEWEPRYIAARSWTSLAMAALEITLAIHASPRRAAPWRFASAVTAPLATLTEEEGFDSQL